MTLFLYVTRRFLFSLLRVQLGIFALILLLVATEQLRALSEKNVSLAGKIEYIALSMPQMLTLVFPLVVLIASLFTFIGLSRSSEMVIIRAAGTSAIKILLAPIITTIIIGVIGVATINPIVAATVRKYELIQARISGNNISRLSISSDGLWLRQETETSQFVIQAQSSNSGGDILYNVRFNEFTTEGVLIRRIESGRAALQSGEWRLSNAVQWRFPDIGQAGESDKGQFSELLIPTNLTRDRILESFASPESLSIWGIPTFIQQLEASGFSAVRHKLFFQSQLAVPLFLVAMVLIGASFSMRHVRFGHTGIMSLLAVLSGFLLFAIKNIAESLGEAQEIPITFAVWSPAAAAILLSLTLVLHLEDG